MEEGEIGFKKWLNFLRNTGRAAWPATVKVIRSAHGRGVEISFCGLFIYPGFNPNNMLQMRPVVFPWTVAAKMGELCPVFISLCHWAFVLGADAALCWQHPCCFRGRIESVLTAVWPAPPGLRITSGDPLYSFFFFFVHILVVCLL